MKIYNTIFIKHHTPITSSADENLQLCRCTFISCFSENEAGVIHWASQKSDVFISNIIAASCGSKNYVNLAFIRGNALSLSIISIANSKNGSHTFSLGSNTLVFDSNISQCQSDHETLLLANNQAEVRLCRIDSCYTNDYVVLGFLSRYISCSFTELKNCTSASKTVYGVLRATDDILVYRSNFIDNVGNVILYIEKGYTMTAVDCYFKDTSQRSCNGNLNIVSESSLNEIPIVGAKGYQKESQKNVMKYPISVLHFVLLISTVIVDLSLNSDSMNSIPKLKLFEASGVEG